MPEQLIYNLLNILPAAIPAAGQCDGSLGKPPGYDQAVAGVVKPPGRIRNHAAGWGLVPEQYTTQNE